MQCGPSRCCPVVFVPSGTPRSQPRKATAKAPTRQDDEAGTYPIHCCLGIDGRRRAQRTVRVFGEEEGFSLVEPVHGRRISEFVNMSTAATFGGFARAQRGNLPIIGSRESPPGRAQTRKVPLAGSPLPASLLGALHSKASAMSDLRAVSLWFVHFSFARRRRLRRANAVLRLDSGLALTDPNPTHLPCGFRVERFASVAALHLSARALADRRSVALQRR